MTTLPTKTSVSKASVLQTRSLKNKTLLLAMSAALLSPAAMADASDAELNELRQQINELRSQLQQLQANQAAQPAPVHTTAPPPAGHAHATAPVNAAAPAPAAEGNWTNKLNVFSKKGAEVDIYGFIRGDASYQAEGASTMYNNISGVPLEGSEEASKQKDRFQATASATRLGLDFKTPTDLGDVGGKLEVDFFGGSNRDQFRIRHAYMTYDKWLLGQTWSNFIAPQYLPESVDAATYVGGSLQRIPQLRYTDKLADSTNYSLSIEDPKYTTRSDPDNEMRIPAITGRINHNFDNGSVMSARSFVTEKKTSTDEDMGWGVGLGGIYKVSPSTELKADYYHVDGDGRMLFWGNSGYAIDADGDMHNNTFDVITVGMTHHFSPKVRSTIGYGYMKADDDNEFADLSYNDTSQNDNLWQGWINAFYKPVEPIEIGAEYVYGERETFDGQTGVDNRVNVTASYHF